MKEKLIDLTISLCAKESITGNEYLCIDFLEDYLCKNDLLVKKIPVNNDSSRFNIFAYSKKLSKYTAIFCTHIDTVAPFIAPYKSADHQKLFGRGVCDAKGIMAAMILALLQEKKRGFEDLALLFTVGEEIASDGAKAVNEVLFDQADFLVIGEPTQLRYASSQKGSLVFDLLSSGKEAHSSMPELGESAIHFLLDDLDKLLKFSWPKDELYGQTLLNIGEIVGGEARNMLAKKAIAKAIMRLSVSADEAKKLVGSILSSHTTMNVLSATDPFSYFVPPDTDEFVAGFGSDAPYLSKLASKIILMGPGKLEYAHKPDEQITVDEIHEGYLAYVKLAQFLRGYK